VLAADDTLAEWLTFGLGGNAADESNDVLLAALGTADVAMDALPVPIEPVTAGVVAAAESVPALPAGPEVPNAVDVGISVEFPDAAPVAELVLIPEARICDSVTLAEVPLDGVTLAELGDGVAVTVAESVEVELLVLLRDGEVVVEPDSVCDTDGVALLVSVLDGVTVLDAV
jgi:hypothetical protein